MRTDRSKTNRLSSLRASDDRDTLQNGASLLNETIIDPRANSLIRETLRKLGPTCVAPAALIGLIQSPGKDVDRIIKAIETCPTLTARLLSVINSAAYGMPRQISTVQRAVMMLGASRARTIAMSYGLKILTEQTPLPRDLIEQLWYNSIRKACAARMMCEIHAPDLADEAYCLGMIQDIGLPMLIAVDQELYTGTQIHFGVRMKWCEVEKANFGFSHNAVGHGLLAEWKAATHLQRSVLNHHRPPKDIEPSAESTLKLTNYFVSLMPHVSEEPTSRELDWMTAIHARYLTPQYNTPEAFFTEVNNRAAEVAKSGGGHHYYNDDQLITCLTGHVAAHTISVTAKLCYMEQRTLRQREGIADLKFQAFTDPLTKVLNRRGFTQLAQRRIEIAKAEGLGVCCMLGDLDNFKAINDSYGHEAGDMVLRGMAKILRRHLKENDMIARIGGDEFAIFIHDISREDAAKLAERMAETTRGKSMRVRPDVSVKLRYTLGAIHYAFDGKDIDIDDLLSLADQAMYERKRQGKNGLCFSHYPRTDAPAKANPKSQVRQVPREA